MFLLLKYFSSFAAVKIGKKKCAPEKYFRAETLTKISLVFWSIWWHPKRIFWNQLTFREMTKTAWPKIPFKKVCTLLQPARSRIYLKLKIQVKMELSFSGAEGQDEQLMDCTTITTAFYFMSPPRAFLKLQPLRCIHKIC